MSICLRFAGIVAAVAVENTDSNRGEGICGEAVVVGMGLGVADGVTAGIILGLGAVIGELLFWRCGWWCWCW